MKVIGLINRIYEGTQPKHIRIYNEDWYWNDYDGYVTKGSLKTTPDAQTYLFDRYRMMFALDNEVEIIEENKKIEKIGLDDWVEFTTKKDIDNLDYMFNKNSRTFVDKINEIIEVINNEYNK